MTEIQVEQECYINMDPPVECIKRSSSNFIAGVASGFKISICNMQILNNKFSSKLGPFISIQRSGSQKFEEDIQ